MRYAVVIEQAENNYSAYVPDLPGCIATGNSIAETDDLRRRRAAARGCAPRRSGLRVERHRVGGAARGHSRRRGRRELVSPGADVEPAPGVRTAEGTVKNQVSSILAKMGVSDRVMAVLNAIEFGII